MSVLIWVQTVCKGYQHMTKVASSKEKGWEVLFGRYSKLTLFWHAAVLQSNLVLSSNNCCKISGLSL